MTRAVENHLAGGKGKVLSSSCLHFSQAFSWDHFGRRLREICHDLVTVKDRI
jgi:hypothetical protein